MEQKRAMTSVDLAALAGELRAYEGAKLDKAYLYEDDLVRLKLRDFDRGRVELLLEVGDPKRAHVARPERVPDAPGRPPNFAMQLRNRLSGADFAGVEQYEFDRILSFRFTREDADTTVVAELFGDGNVAMCDADRKVLACLETVRLKSRTVAPGSQYEFPESRFNPLTADFGAFEARMEQSDTDVVRTLATQLNFGGLWAEELCTRAGVEKTLAIADAGADAYERLFDAVERLRDRLRDGDLDPRIYREDDRPVDVTPVPLSEYEGRAADVRETFNEALDDYFADLEREEPDAGVDRPDFEAEIAKHQRIIDQQEQAIEEFDERAERKRAEAEALYAHYDLVDEVLRTVREAREAGRSWGEIEDRLAEGSERGIPAASAVVDVEPAEGTLTLELSDDRATVDPATGVEKNADRLYGEAKRIAEKRAGAEAAIEDTREDLAEAKRRRERWEASEDGGSEGAGAGPEGGDAAGEGEADGADVDWLSRASIPVRYEEQWYERFRWFHTGDDFLVIGGRNADQNEELVKKYTERGDRFFHAQAHGGPVTVLKATGPSEAARDVDIPEASREQAAQFAVSYSSVWKEGKFAGDVYEVAPDQVSKTPESGEYLEKGGFAVRGERTYYRDTPVGVAIGVACEPETRVLGGPPAAVEPRTVTSVRVEPGRFAQNDVAKRIYREFRERFSDQSFLRKVASPDRIQEFCPPGGSRIVEV